LPIFLIVLVDVFGFTIVIPLLSLFAEKFGATPLVATTIVSVYAVCSLISTPIIGRLSDKHGRRPLLLLSQAGTCLGFLVLASAQMFPTIGLGLVFLGRILDGLTAGNLSLAQAYISDHTEPQNRAKAFGVIGVAFGIGFFFGPALGGLLGNINLSLPFVVAAAMSLTSMTFTYTILSKDLPPQAPQHAKPEDPAAPAPPAGRRPSAFDIDAYLEYFRRPGVGALYLQFFLFCFAFSCFTSGFALYAERRFGWKVEQTGLLFSFSGFLGMILQGGLLGRLVKKFGEGPLVIMGFIAAAIAYALLGFAHFWQLLLVAATFSAFGNGVLRPVITSRITQAVGRHEQGAALGVSGSLQSIALVLSPLVGGALIDGGHLTEWALVSATTAIIGLIATGIARKPPKITPAVAREKKPKPAAAPTA
jgi:MFS family permease